MQDARTKVYFFGFIFLFVIFATSSVYSYSLFSESRDELIGATRNNDKQLEQVMKMRVAVRERAIILWHMTLEKDFFNRDTLFETFYHYGAEYKKAREQFLSLTLSSEEEALFRALDSETNKRAPVLRDFAAKLMSDGQEDYTKELNQTLSDQIVVAEILDRLISLQQHQNNIARANSTQQIESILTNQVQLLIFIFGFGFIFAGFVIHSSSKQRALLSAANQLLAEQACHDSLTGLKNRGFLLEQLEILLANARRHKHRGAVMFIDLDNFKPINDTLGHKVGDQLLQEISARMKQEIRDSDLLSRLGGDEFILLLTDMASGRECAAVAKKLLHAIATEFEVEGHKITTTASIGIYLLNDGHLSAEEAIMQADKAMYQAKAMGKNCYYVI